VKVNGLLSRRLNPFSFDVCVVAAFSSCPQPLARSRANVLRHAAALAKDEALRLAPAARHPELPPHVRPSTLHEIDAIGVAENVSPQRAVEIVAFTMAVDQSL
jgi:hypothetical protein